MAVINTINIGTTANDGTGDTLRAAMAITNSNFTNVNTQVEDVQTLIGLPATSTVLTGFVPGVAAVSVDATDTIFLALQKIQGSLDNTTVTENFQALTPTGTNTLPNLLVVPESPATVQFYINGVQDYAKEITSDALGVVTVAGSFAATYGFSIDTTDVVTAVYLS